MAVLHQMQGLGLNTAICDDGLVHLRFYVSPYIGASTLRNKGLRASPQGIYSTRDPLKKEVGVQGPQQSRGLNSTQEPDAN